MASGNDRKLGEARRIAANVANLKKIGADLRSASRSQKGEPTCGATIVRAQR
jgi:hypothetical protein